ncbi:MAG: hypothetical protein Q9169_004439 [Polycauliona sp. 2 TL-2023]
MTSMNLIVMPGAVEGPYPAGLDGGAVGDGRQRKFEARLTFPSDDWRPILSPDPPIACPGIAIFSHSMALEETTKSRMRFVNAGLSPVQSFSSGHSRQTSPHSSISTEKENRISISRLDWMSVIGHLLRNCGAPHIRTLRMLSFDGDWCIVPPPRSSSTAGRMPRVLFGSHDYGIRYQTWHEAHLCQTRIQAGARPPSIAIPRVQLAQDVRTAKAMKDLPPSVSSTGRLCGSGRLDRPVDDQHKEHRCIDCPRSFQLLLSPKTYAV